VNIQSFSSTAAIVCCLACTGGASREPNIATGASMPPAVASAVPVALVSPESFQLLWEDPFDTLDTKRWSAQTHSWDGNLAQFSRDNVAVVDGRLQLGLTRSGRTEKPFDGVEYRSIDAITYGKVEASMRFAKGSGVVSSLVLIYTPWPPDDWNELDIECLGNTKGEVQFNHMINIPPADPVSQHRQFPKKIDMGFDPTAAFHTYTIEWLPNYVRFLVDGVVVHQPTQEISRLVLPQNILLTIWASGAPSWAGPINDATAPTLAEVDWLRVYSYTAP
jgi:endo-1,3-1,4-beta-glycanase ExoK